VDKFMIELQLLYIDKIKEAERFSVNKGVAEGGVKTSYVPRSCHYGRDTASACAHEMRVLQRGSKFC
jgi:hypothetical protein